MVVSHYVNTITTHLLKKESLFDNFLVLIEQIIESVVGLTLQFCDKKQIRKNAFIFMANFDKTSFIHMIDSEDSEASNEECVLAENKLL